MFFERLHVWIEAAEQEPTIGFKAGDLCEVMRAFLIEGIWIPGIRRILYL
jgi:hypothetical protein